MPAFSSAWPCKCVTFLTLLSAKQHFCLFYSGEGAFCWTKEDQEVLKNVTVVLAADGEFAFRICEEAGQSSLDKSVSSFRYIRKKVSKQADHQSIIKSRFKISKVPTMKQIQFFFVFYLKLMDSEKCFDFIVIYDDSLTDAFIETFLRLMEANKQITLLLTIEKR